MSNQESYYIQRINRALDFIEENYERKLTTPELAKVSAFSEFHFHRIFKAIIGETVFQYIKRLKMAKSKRALKLNNKSITEVAFNFGYQSSANFARDFKQYFNKSASEVRKELSIPKGAHKKPSDLDLTFQEIRDYPDIPLIYKRVLTGYNPQKIRDAFQELLIWLQNNQIPFDQVQSYGVGYDDPDYVDPDKCRYDACVSLKKERQVDLGNFNTKILQPGKCCVYRFVGKSKDFHRAWDYIFQEIIQSNKYRPGNKPHFEEYLFSDQHTEGIFKANLCLPIDSTIP